MKRQFPEWVQFKAPLGFSLAVSTAASRGHRTVSEYIRQCVIGRLRQDGVTIQPQNQTISDEEHA
jgi:hypothetical protein